MMVLREMIWIIGHVRVYKWDGTNWVQRGTDLDGESTEDESGASVSINDDGDWVIIGAQFADAPGKGNTGHARVYRWDGTAWSKIGDDIDGEAGDQLGNAVTMNSLGSSVVFYLP